MTLDLVVEIGQPGQVVPVHIPFRDEDVHHAERQRRIRPGPHDERHVGRLDGGGAVDVDDREQPAALPGTSDVGHHVDLGRYRVAAPGHDEVGVRHLARIGADELADARLPAGFGRRHADRGLLAAVAFHVPEAVDAPALDDAHVAAGMVRPDGLGTPAPLGAVERVRDLVQRLVPADGREPARPLGARPAERPGQAVGMLHALGVAGDLRADDAGRVGVATGAADAADAPPVQHLDLERAGARAIVRGQADFRITVPASMRASSVVRHPVADPGGGAR